MVDHPEAPDGVLHEVAYNPFGREQLCRCRDFGSSGFLAFFEAGHHAVFAWCDVELVEPADDFDVAACCAHAAVFGRHGLDCLAQWGAIGEEVLWHEHPVDRVINRVRFIKEERQVGVPIVACSAHEQAIGGALRVGRCGLTVEDRLDALLDCLICADCWTKDALIIFAASCGGENLGKCGRVRHVSGGDDRGDRIAVYIHVAECDDAVEPPVRIPFGEFLHIRIERMSVVAGWGVVGKVFACRSIVGMQRRIGVKHLPYAGFDRAHQRGARIGGELLKLARVHSRISFPFSMASISFLRYASRYSSTSSIVLSDVRPVGFATAPMAMT